MPLPPVSTVPAACAGVDKVLVVDVEDRDDSAWKELTPYSGGLEAAVGPLVPNPLPAVRAIIAGLYALAPYIIGMSLYVMLCIFSAVFTTALLM